MSVVKYACLVVQSSSIITSHGLHAGALDGVCSIDVRDRGAKELLVGVLGRMRAPGISGSTSARRMNCKAVKGDPGADGVDLTERGLLLDGVERAKTGIRDGLPLGSGVRGGAGGVLTVPSSGVSSRVVELIHFSSRTWVERSGESGKMRNRSAK